MKQACAPGQAGRAGPGRCLFEQIRLLPLNSSAQLRNSQKVGCLYLKIPRPKPTWFFPGSLLYRAAARAVEWRSDSTRLPTADEQGTE